MKYLFKYFLLIMWFLPLVVFSAQLNKPTDRSDMGEYIFNVKSMPNIKALSFSPDGKELWGTSLLNGKTGVFVVDPETGKKISNINLKNGGGVEIVFLRDGTKAYISQMETAKIFEIDTKTKEILRSFNTKGNWTKILFLSFDEKTLYATNWLSNDVSIIDLNTGKLIKKIKTVKTPRGIYVTEDEKFIYIAGYDKGELQKIDLKTNTGKVIYKSNGALRHIVGDNTKKVLYISDMAKRAIYKLNLNTDEVEKFLTTDSHPNTIELMHGGRILVVSCRGVNNPKSYYIPGPTWGSVQFFDTDTGELLDAIIGGNQPTALSINNSKVAFSNFLDKEIEVFNFPAYEKLVENSILSTWAKDYKKLLIK